MPKRLPPLTDKKCRAIKHAPGGKNRHFDGGGLYLEVLASGSKRWRLKYRRPISRKENTLTFGPYPQITLAAARALREKAKEQLSQGLDPAESNDDFGKDPRPTFLAIAELCLETRQAVWSAGYYQRVSNALKANIYPYFGDLPIENINGKMVLDAVKRVEERGALEMATRVLDAVGMVFRYGCGIGMAQTDVTQGLRQFLRERPPVQHFPHVSKEDLPHLLKSIEQYHGRPETRLAIQLMMRTFPRTNELRWAEWSEFNFEEALWLIPGSRMKGRLVQKEIAPEHIIPLSAQSLEILKRLHEHTGKFKFLFPNVHNPRNSVMSGDTINKALKVMGFDGVQTGHGFRGLASTIMNEESNIRPDAIERQLAHRDRNMVRRAYNHAQYLAERIKLMQWWSDYLDEQRNQP